MIARTTTLLFLLMAVNLCTAQRDFRKEATQLKRVLVEKHVQPRAFDNQLSVDIYTTMLDEADPYRIYFSVEDMKTLGVFRELIDDEINGGAPWVFLNKFEERYRAALVLARQNFERLAVTQILSGTVEKFAEAPEGFEKDKVSLQTRQRLFLKNRTLEKVSQFAARDSVSCEDVMRTRAAEIVEKVKKSQLNEIDRVIVGRQPVSEKVGAVFLQAMTQVFDPHTLYLSAPDLKKFVGSLATEDFYFGFTLTENERGEIAIGSLMPGGPAWKSGQMHIADILISIETGEGDLFDFTDIDLDEAYESVDAVTTSTAQFTLRRPDGVTKKIALTKAKIEAEENFVRSFVLEGDKKIGYIHLPDFYTTWGATDEGSRCANDVAREIIKLKGDNIQGLILDLRFNGGGSLYEAMEMAGIFIEEGPLGQIRDRERTTTLKDMNRGTVYDGPLVILVNGMSASASEVVAAALQDYNRGLVVGSQTYGKATGQTILPVNEALSGSNIDELVDDSEGFIKVTIERLYRVNGKSLQGRGITPDVTIPDLLEKLDIRESANLFTLPPDSIDRKTYFKPLAKRDVRGVKARSAERLAANASFKDLMGVDVRGLIEDSEPLDLDLKRYCNRATTAIRMAAKSDAPYKVSNNSFDVLRLQVDQYADAYNQSWYEKLRGDITLHEAYLITSDFISLNRP
jgi:carboxyl-terminal processing protease